MNTVNIEIDEIPKNIDDLACNNYTDLIIRNILCQRLRDGCNCNIYTKDYVVYAIELLSNYGATIDGIINCIKWNIQNKKNLYYEFFEINGFAQYIKTNEYNKLAIKKISSTKLQIELRRPNKLFYYVLQSANLIPLNSNGLEFNGNFKIENLNNNSIELLRKEHSSLYVNRINFIYNRSISEGINLYIKNKVDITCHTQFNNKYIYLKQTEDFCAQESLLMYYLYIKDSEVLNCIKLNFDKNKIVNMLNGNLKKLDTLVCFEDYTSCKNMYYNIKNSKYKRYINIVYADYYPNYIIVNEICSVLNSKGYICKQSAIKQQSDFAKINKEKYDIILKLAFPIYENPLSFCKTFLYDFNTEDKIKIIEALYHKNIEYLKRKFEQTCHYLPLFKSEFRYYKNKAIKNYILSKDGILNIDNLKWEE